MSPRVDIPNAKNLQMSTSGSVMYLYCDLSKDFGLTTSGKSYLISSSSGNKALGKSGAFLGFNVFVKDLKARKLTAEGVGSLRGDAFTAVGEGCEWRVEKNNKTLCIKIDFAAVKPKTGASAKSMLLASTKGNKPIGDTGLMCGLNCYCPLNVKFDVTKLAGESATQRKLNVGESITFDTGFTLAYAAANAVRIAYMYVAADMVDDSCCTLPPFQLDNMTVTASVKAIKAARTRTEAARKDKKVPPPPPAPQLGESGGFLLSQDQQEKVRNVTATCEAAADEDKPLTAGADVYSLTFTFDPTQTCGRSSTGRSILVASSGGFQVVADGSGQPVCRASLNAFRPAPPVTSEEAGAAVHKVLSAKSAGDFAQLSFKDVLAEVMQELGAEEAMKESLKRMIKEKVGEYMQNLAK